MYVRTVEPLFMDTLSKGHSRINLHIKDRFNHTCILILHLNPQREDILHVCTHVHVYKGQDTSALYGGFTVHVNTCTCIIIIIYICTYMYMYQ